MKFCEFPFFVWQCGHHLEAGLGDCKMLNRAPCRTWSTTHKLWLIMQLKPCGYLVLATQDTASSNCSRCECCPFGDIACLALDSCLVLTKVRAAHKTLTSPSVTLRKLSLLPCLTKTQLALLNLGSDNFPNRTRTTTRSYNGNFIYCNKWLCNIIEMSFQGRDNTNIRKRQHINIHQSWWNVWIGEECDSRWRDY